MARRRSIADADLLDAALALMAAEGPEAVTFAAVSAATGLAPATLVQRFGSKPALVKAALTRAWDLLDARTEEIANETEATPAGALALLVALSGDYAEGDAYADQLMILREDLRDPDLRIRGRQWRERLCAILAPRLAGRQGPDEDGARELTALWQGAVLWWGFERDGTPGSYVETMLGSWLRRRSSEEN